MISERVKRGELREKILRFIPSYGHYKLEEERREWDRSIRDEANFYLSKSENSFINMLDIAVAKRDKELIISLEKERKGLHIFKEKIKTQNYGYFPRFSPIKIDKNVLENVLELDEEVVDKCKVFNEKITAILNKFVEGAEKEAKLDLQDVMVSLQSIDRILSERFEIVRTGVLE